MRDKVALLDRCFSLAGALLGHVQGVCLALEEALPEPRLELPIADENGKRVRRLVFDFPKQEPREVALEILDEAIEIAAQLWHVFQEVRHDLSGTHEVRDIDGRSASSAHEVVWLMSDRVWRSRKPRVFRSDYVPGVCCTLIESLDLDTLAAALDVEHSRAVRHAEIVAASARMADAAAIVARPVPPSRPSKPAKEGEAHDAEPEDPARQVESPPSQSASREGQIPRPARTTTSPVQSPCFFRDGDGWTVEFAGKRVVIRNLTGMRHIQSLLAAPGTPLSATVLDGLTGPTESRQEILGSLELRIIQARLTTIDATLDDDEIMVGAVEKEELLREKAQLNSQRGTAQGGGRRRTMQSDAGRATGRVRSAIGRALEAIGEKHSPLAEHLRESLIGRNGNSPIYRPIQSLVWRVNA